MVRDLVCFFCCCLSFACSILSLFRLVGGDDFKLGAEFILARFQELNRNNLPLYPHLTCATDTKNIKFVLDAVRDTLLTSALKRSGLM